MTDTGKVDLIEPQKETPINPTTSTNDGFAKLKEAWKGSILIKILSAAIAVIALLFIIFFITTIVLSSQGSSARTEKDAIDKKLKVCNSDLSKTRNDIEECKRNSESKERSVRELKSQLDRIKKETEQVKKDLDVKKKQVDECNTENSKCKTSVEALTRQLTDCDNSLRNLRNEEAELKRQLEVKNAEHTKAVGDIYFYEIGLICSGVLHVIVIAEDIYAHSTWTTCHNALNQCNSNYLNCNGSLHNCEGECHNYRTRITILENQLKECGAKKETCNTNLRTCEDEKRKVEKENGDLRKVINELPQIAVEQSMMHELIKEANYTYTSTIKFNGSFDGYHKNDFIRAMGSAPTSVIIVRAKTGELFGGFLGIKWAAYGGWTEDPKAFIFDATPPYKGCVINTKNAVNFDADFVEFGGEFIVHASNSKVTNGVYECKSDSRGRVEFEVADMYGFEINLMKKP